DTYDSSGNIEARMRKRPNGDYVRTNAQGQIEEYFDSKKQHGALFGYDIEGKLDHIIGEPPVGNWTREKRADGTTYWQNSKDPKQQFDGEMTIDSDANIYQTPHDSSANVRILKRAGASVEVVERTGTVKRQ